MREGKIPQNVWKRSVQRQISYRRAEVAYGAVPGGDCAVFAPLEGGTASAVEAGPVGEPNALGRLIVRCANSLAAGGAAGFAVQLGLVLPVEMEEPQLKALMAEAVGVCEVLEMELAGGHTTVSAAVREPVATATVYGRADAWMPDRNRMPVNLRAARARPGQAVVVTKWIGLEGTAVLARRYREPLQARYPAALVAEAADFLRYQSILKEAAAAVKSGGGAMHDASEGGILAALWEMCERSGVGLNIDLRQLPIRQETVEVCELVGANPYLLASGGCLIVAADDGPGLAAALEAEGIPARIVGNFTDGHDRILRNGDEIRYLDRPAEDELWRFPG